MFIPELKVSMIDPEDNVRFIRDYMSREKGENTTRPFYEKTLLLYPELREVRDVRDEREREAIVRRAVVGRLTDHREEIQGRIRHFQQVFDGFLPDFLRAACDLFQYRWREDQPQIRCYVGYLPFYPRSAREKCFYISYQDEERVFSGAVHEIDHMIFFEKWNEMHGGDREERYWPDPLWYLMEAVVDPTLNDERVRPFTLYENRAYPMFYEKDPATGTSVMDRIRECYRNREGMESFLEEAYGIVREVYGAPS